ncbi:MAG: hypothetical protein ABI480_06850, partial [Chitinophagaceae bacterium]
MNKEFKNTTSIRLFYYVISTGFSVLLLYIIFFIISIWSYSVTTPDSYSSVIINNKIDTLKYISRKQINILTPDAGLNKSSMSGVYKARINNKTILKICPAKVLTIYIIRCLLYLVLLYGAYNVFLIASKLKNKNGGNFNNHIKQINTALFICFILSIPSLEIIANNQGSILLIHQVNISFFDGFSFFMLASSLQMENAKVF